MSDVIRDLLDACKKERDELRAELAVERERRQFAEAGLKLFRDAKIQWRVRAETAEAELAAERERGQSKRND